MKDLAGKKITARVTADAAVESGTPLLIQPSGPVIAQFKDNTILLHLPPGSAVNALEGLEEVREPISSLPVGTFVEVTRINVGDDEAPAHLKGRWRGMILKGQTLPLLDPSVVGTGKDPWRTVRIDDILEWKVVE